MKTLTLSIALIFSFLLAFLAYAASPPAEFGDESSTTCYIGGTDGNLNCTGFGIFGGYINVSGTVWSQGINLTAGVTTITAIINNSNAGNITLSEVVPDGFFVGNLDTGTIRITEDIDKEHIEGDLNTFVDIAGDNITGTLIAQNINGTYGNFSQSVLIEKNLVVNGNISTSSNFSINTNQKISLGDGGEGEIYYDGTKLVIKVN